jgi:oxygen-independent coproporphyrinogen-3 oxidase
LSQSPRAPFGIYIHVPFCAAICNYCNFNRGLFDADLKARFVDAVCREIRSSGTPQVPADSIFFGGGTPSLLAPADVERILNACHDTFALAADSEITMEANPEGVTPELLGAFRTCGVNRISFGVQSFRDDELRRLTRLHSASRAREAVADARRSGFDNLSLDLMMWLPGQTVAQWLESVDALIEVGPDHASLYMLEVYPNAPLRDLMARAALSVAPDDDVAEMYLRAMERLEEAGFEQYEISNVARPGRRSRHNLKYWQDGEWIGVGPGAHSTRAGVRTKNESSVTTYLNMVETGIPVTVERREMDPATQLEEALFTGLRLSDGVVVADIARRYGVDPWSRFGEALQPFVDGGWLRYDGVAFRLTRPGMLVAHDIMAVFVESAGEPRMASRGTVR